MVLDSPAASDEGAQIAPDSYTAQVERAVEVGRPLREIEEKIDSWPIRPERRDALWLLAWAKADLADRGRPVRRFQPDDPADN